MENCDKKKSRAEIDYDAYSKAVKGEPVIVILRVHLLTEYYLEQIIRVFLPRGDKLIESGNLSYNQKLVLVESFDEIADQYLSCLKNLNKIRNKCAHEIDRAITFHDVELIGRPLGKQYTEIKRERENTVNGMLAHVLGEICVYFSAHIEIIELKMHSPDKNPNPNNKLKLT